MFASITYGPLEPQAVISQRIAIMHAATHGKAQWLGDASPNRMKFDTARSLVAKQVCDSEFPDDAKVFWCDSDVVLPADAITRLALSERDFITGIYFQRENTLWPLIAHRVPDKGFQWIVKWPENAVFPIDGCGFGCVLTSLKLLRSLGDEPFKYEEFSEDFDFCVKAKNKGFDLYCDSSVLCGHLAEPVPVRFEDFKKRHPEVYGHEASQVGV